MLRIDFGQSFVDQRSILVLIKKLGSVREDEFSQLFHDISQLRTVELPNSRTVYLRYTRHISHQFVEWGSFHTHKKLLGILSIARCSADKDFSSIKTAHEALKTWYSNTTLDSRCFLLGYEKPKDEEKRKYGEFIFLNADNLMKEIENEVANYAMSLFLVLESKRMDKTLEKPEKVTLLRSPLDADTIDENRNRKQCLGRMKKYMGDLCLVAGLPQDAVFHYSVGIDLLRSVGDMLWLCGCTEGLCAASLLSRSEKKEASFERPSLQLNVDQLSIAGPVNGVSGDAEELRLATAIPLTDDEIIEKCDDIFQVYERHKESRVLGFEARFKYARFFISKKKYKEASNAIQDVLSIEFTLSEAEKIQQYNAMAIMYEDIGFTRKAAFFTRLAALHCTSQHLPLQGWTASYNLLRNALEGYKIHFGKNAQEGTHEGWPDLQITLMRELIKMSEELQNPEIPIRHISYLLHVMYKHMKENDICNLITSLENLAESIKKCSLIDDLVLPNGDILPPVSLTELPVVRAMKVNVLASHLRPFVSPSSPVKTPFIFSTLNKKPRKNLKSNPVVNWVDGDVGEVAMQVFNPMPFDVKVSKMTLLTEGIPFEAFPSCLALSNDTMSHPFMLLGIPQGPGQLRITGYSVEVFGIQSNCPITETILDNPLDLPLIVNVTPMLPLLQFQSSISGIKSSINSSHKGSTLFLGVTLYNGQSISGPIIVENVSKISVEKMSITVLSTFKSDHSNMIKLMQDKVMASLPIHPGTNSQFDLGFYALHHVCHGDNSLQLSGKIKITYGGGVSWGQGLSRQATIDFKIDVWRSLHCSHYTVKTLHQGDGQHFELSMDIHNHTTHNVEWKFEVKGCQDEIRKILPAGVTSRASVILEKFDLSKTDNKELLYKWCVEKLLELVKLHWRIPDHQMSGVVNLDGLKINEAMVNTLRKYRFTCEIALQGLTVQREKPFVVGVTTPILVCVKVSNCSDNEVNSSILSIEPFEVDENGVQIFEVKPKICWLGSASTLLPKIGVGGTAQHSCGFIFLCPGQYFINIRCFETECDDLEKTFRGRTQVINGEFHGYRRSRSSRTESFTDTLLLRQRSYSAPLTKLDHLGIIHVVEDANTEVRDTECSSVDNEDENCGELIHCEAAEGFKDNIQLETGRCSEENQKSFENQKRGNEMESGACEDFKLSSKVTECSLTSIMSRGNASGERDSTTINDERKTSDDYKKEKLNEQINEERKGEVKEETEKEIVEQMGKQADDKTTHDNSSSARNDETNSGETTENDEEIIRSPTVQERIMFFNSNEGIE